MNMRIITGENHNGKTSVGGSNFKSMKKLFLASSGLGALPEFLGKDPKDLKLVFVPTAANPYPNPSWVKNDRKDLKKLGFKITEVDVEGKSKSKLEELCKDVDVIYIAGGNTFYLLDKVLRSGFDEIIKEKVNEGVVYVGASAGACLVAPDIEPVKYGDDPKEAPDLETTKGLELVDFLVIPHFDEPQYQEGHTQLIKEYESKFKLIPLNNEQAVLVEGDEYKIVDSKEVSSH